MSPARRRGAAATGATAGATTDTAAEATAPEPQLVVTQVRSAIGVKPKHRGTLRALGLRRVGSSRRLPDRREIRGMIARVPHLVEVEEQASNEEVAR